MVYKINLVLSTNAQKTVIHIWIHLIAEWLAGWMLTNWYRFIAKTIGVHWLYCRIFSLVTDARCLLCHFISFHLLCLALISFHFVVFALCCFSSCNRNKRPIHATGRMLNALWLYSHCKCGFVGTIAITLPFDCVYCCYSTFFCVIHFLPQLIR